MGNTEGYNEFKEWMGKIGTREGDYHLSDHFLDELSDSERNEVETIMYDVFKSNGDCAGYFARYMRYLRNYDGMATLKWFLDEYPLSFGMADVIVALYEATLEPKYIDMLVDLYKTTGESTIISRMYYCIPSQALFDAMAYIYVHDTDDGTRVMAKSELLYAKGYTNDLYGFGKWSEEEMSIRRLLNSDDVGERKKFAEKLRANQPLIEGIPVSEPRF